MRRFRNVLIAIGVLILCAIVSAMLLLYTEAGSRWAVNQARSRLPEGWTFSSFSGRIVGPFEILGLELAAGPLHARIERAQVYWQPWDLLNARATFDSIQVTGALVRWDSLYTPEAEPAVADTTASGWLIRWEKLHCSGVTFEGPNAIRLDQLDLISAGSPDSFTVQVQSNVSYDTITGVTLSATGQGGATYVDFQELQIARDSTHLVATGRFEWDPKQAWMVNFVLTGLNPADWFPVAAPLHGNLRLTGKSDGSIDSDVIEYAVHVDSLSGVLAGDPVTGRASLRMLDDAMYIDSARIESRGLSAQAHGVVADTVQLSWEAGSPDLSLWQNGYKGAIHLEGEAHGPRDALEVHASIQAERPEFDQYSAARVVGELEWMAGGHKPSHLFLQLDSAIVSGRTLDTVQLDAEGTQEAHTIQAMASSVDGRVELKLSGGYDLLWQGNLESLEILHPKYGRFWLEAPMPLLAGADTLAFSGFKLNGEQGSVYADGAARWPDHWQIDARVDSLRSDWLCTLFTANMVLDSRINGEFHVTSGPADDVEGVANITASSGRLLLRELPADTILTDTLTMNVNWTQETGLLQANGGATLRGEHTPFQVSMEFPGTKKVLPLLRADTMSWRSIAWSGTFDIDPLTLGLLDPFLPEGTHLDGEAVMHVTAGSGPAGTLIGECELKLPPGYIAVWTGTDTLRLQWSASQLTVRADSNGCMASAQSSLSTEGKSVGTLDFDLSSQSPVLLSSAVLDLPLQGKMNAQLDLEPLGPFVAGTSGLKGSFQAGATIQGTPRDLAVEGNLELSAEALLQDLGIQVTDVHLSMNASGGSTSVQGRATSGGGTLELTGTMSRLPSHEKPTRLSVTGANFLAIDTRQSSVWVSPDLELVMGGDSLNLSGRVDVPKAKIEILELPEQTVEASKDVVIVSDTVLETGSSSPFWLKVTLGLGDDVFFKGFDVAGFLRGSLDISQAPGSEAQARGEVTIHEGRYRGMGQDLQIDPGRLIFSGSLVDPTIDAIAYRRATDNTRAGFKVSGQLSSPEVDMFADPMKSDNDIMAYILFGRPVEASSEADQLKASEAAAYLGGNLLAAQAAGRFGLDEARIDPGYTGNDAALVAGKYISPKLFVGYGQGLFETLHTLRIRYLVSTHISLQAETGTRETADVLYQIERGK